MKIAIAGTGYFGLDNAVLVLLCRCLYMPWVLPGQRGPDMQAPVGARRAEALNQGNGRDRLGISALEMSAYMRHQLLRDADWVSMAHSLEIRTPFVNTRLVQAVAPWLAAHPHLTKRDVAAAIAPKLSSKMQKKLKTGFSVPVRDWLMGDQVAAQARGLRGWARHLYGRHMSHYDVKHGGSSLIVRSQ